MCAALFAHVVTLFSVTYWDQMHVAWWGLLAIISSVTSRTQVQEPVIALVSEMDEPSADGQSEEQEFTFSQKASED
jgi:hypothetical protein